MQRDGTGCQFWRWDDEYEQYLMTKGHVPDSYQPIFSSNLPLVQNRGIIAQGGNEVARSSKAMQTALCQILQKMTTLEEVGRNIILLLKCIV